MTRQLRVQLCSTDLLQGKVSTGCRNRLVSAATDLRHKLLWQNYGTMPKSLAFPPSFRTSFEHRVLIGFGIRLSYALVRRSSVGLAESRGWSRRDQTNDLLCSNLLKV